MTFPPDILPALARNERPTAGQTEEALGAILRGEASDAQIGALLLGLEMMGLSAQEIRIGTQVMRQNMTPAPTPYDVIDIVGTGGTGLHTLSISTAAAIVCAGAGARVAKHGNRAASSLTGTADTLSELGVHLGANDKKFAQCVHEAGIGFLFAPNHHPAMRHVGPARVSLKIRTLFNVLGPLCNPASAKRQLLGVSENRLRHPIAEALVDLDAKHVWVVHGSDGLDEITTTGVSFVTEVKDGKIREFEIHPNDYGIQTQTIDVLRGGLPHVNARALTALLEGAQGPYRDIVLLNCAAALHIAGLCEDMEAGLERARESIDSGKAKQSLHLLRALSNG